MIGNDVLADLAERVWRLRPGEWLTISASLLDEIPVLDHNGARWRPEERVLENVVGSAYVFETRVDPLSGNVTFMRHAQPAPEGAYRYVSPDRRHLVELSPDGFWRPRRARGGDAS